jgi:mRNA interferase MazF
MIKGKVVLVPFPFDDFSSTGLRVSSVLRLHRLMTVTTSLFQRELGELPPQIQAEVDIRLRKLFGLK